MYALFLETEAASEIDRFVADHGGDAEDIKLKCYANSVKDGKDDDWWISRCLNDDNHKEFTIYDLFYWRETPEGHEFWGEIHLNKVG